MTDPLALTGGARGRGLVALGLALAAVFIALGVWQVERLAWKRALIAAVDARVAAAPAPTPAPEAWPAIDDRHDAYRHVTVRGEFDNGRETLVQAVTDAGPGFWVVTPLRAGAGFTVLVNRGFVPADRAAPASRASGQIVGPVIVTGLLRISEPHGGFLRANRPEAGRWYSRDVAAIAAARGLAGAAPYFIDADATPNPGGWPRGGLTVIRFRNSHLVYAATWFTLAAMSLGWSFWPAIEGALRRRRGPARLAGADVR
ncbi:SURF1 family protein [Caulobacter sp. KR2-114]|uniref:SURF1 family protein n=1 Tax=Caulobacter sp. KR2-114 TaxID=3400912 RepID=UPI003BFE4348